MLTRLVDGLYWVFVCNPRKWAIDRFLRSEIEHDTWGVRPSDKDRFAPGQLAIVRVGIDQRAVKELNGSPRLVSGIYALCQVESSAFPASGANDRFWAPSEKRDAGWPTVQVRYLRSYLGRPLAIGRLRAEAPGLSRLVLNGFQASSFPISAEDFRTVMTLLDEDLDTLPSPAAPSQITTGTLAAIEEKYRHASPEVKQKLSRTIERGLVGAHVKRAAGFQCQLCTALGRDAAGFLKRNGEFYVEAHHVMPVSAGEVGSLAASNIMVLCANHHRQMHYGQVGVSIQATTFNVTVEGATVSLPRFGIAAPTTVQPEVVSTVADWGDNTRRSLVATG